MVHLTAPQMLKIILKEIIQLLIKHKYSNEHSKTA